ncbi:Type II secretion system protein E [Posidoniimonas polymericola]|uniref:Type II secretion system protein E n=1 Tax=Posidoniimonas polymericola TaxID=2528002 RepID=A0A5C5YME3_9BACT|nr:GspE/PulE family protein [Posidoniimonas polymericola]TWT76141.1 Type II secretion system protein E [Posidoniimonas polymericola]
MTPAPTLKTTDSAPPKRRMRLGEQLLSSGKITQAELEAALKEQRHGQMLGETLVKLGFLEETDLLPFLAQQCNAPWILLREGGIDPVAARMIPRPLAEQLKCIGLFRVQGELTLAMTNPRDLAAIDRVEQQTGLRVRPVLALESAITEFLNRVYGEGFQVETVTADLEEGAVSLNEEAIELDLEGMANAVDESPVINLVNYILLQAVRQRASDIHIEAGPRTTTVRFRIDGTLREVLKPRREFHPALVSRLKVMAKMNIAEHRLPQDGRIHIVVDRREIDVRASTLPTVLGEKVVLRILDRGSVTFRLDELGIPQQQLGTLKTMLDRPHGLILATGPTGSGKTTTLYSAIELIKSVERNIVTVEDPVEYRLDLINQVHVNSGASLTFAKALRSILRQDPDVIMIGEIRDLETAETAVQAALTGHLVLSTLHTNDAASAVTRLVDMGVAPFKISASLLGVVAQRLLRRVCPACRGSYYPPPTMLDAINYGGDRSRQFVRGSGCDRCFDTGCQGRVGVYELLSVDRTLRELITNGASLDELRDHARASGYQPLLQQGLQAAEDGVVSLDEVVRVIAGD